MRRSVSMVGLLCACGKVPYATKAEARLNAPRSGRAYICPLGHPHWHVRGRVSTRQRGTFARGR